MPNLQFVGSLYFDFTLRLAEGFMLDQAKGIAGDLDALTLPLRFHAACYVHGIAPEIIDEFLAAPCIGLMRASSKTLHARSIYRGEERTGKPPAIAGTLTTCCDIVRRAAYHACVSRKSSRRSQPSVNASASERTINPVHGGTRFSLGKAPGVWTGDRRFNDWTPEREIGSKQQRRPEWNILTRRRCDNCWPKDPSA
jgi:hypothetical protein